MAELRARTDRLSESPRGEGSSVYRVHAETTSDGAHGRLDVVDASGATSSREVEGSTCKDVVDALALVLALAVDPNASTAPLPPLAPPAAAPPPVATAIERPMAPPAAPRAPPWSSHLGASAGAALKTGAAPALLVGPMVGLGAAWEPSAQGSRIEPALELRATFTWAQSGTIPVGAGAARFTWTAGLLDVCPVRATAGRVQAAPCARIEGGILDAAGLQLDVNHDVSKPWVAVGAAARVRWAPVGALFVDLDGALLASVLRYHIFFDQPQTTIYDVPLVGAEATLSAGVRFW
jgi:hypothetical protein